MSDIPKNSFVKGFTQAGEEVRGVLLELPNRVVYMPTGLPGSYFTDCLSDLTLLPEDEITPVLQDLVEVVRGSIKRERAEQKTKLCQICSKETAQVYCMNCQRHICRIGCMSDRSQSHAICVQCAGAELFVSRRRTHR